METATEDDIAAREALAEVWAGIDGHGDEFRKEREIANGGFAKAEVVRQGRYAGYMAEADEMIHRLRKRGFDITRIRVAELKVIK